MRASFVFSEVVNGLRRNVTMTIAMILTTAVSVGLLGGGLLVVRMIDKMQETYQDRVEVVVFMTDDVSANDNDCSQQPCANIMADLKRVSGVESVRYENRQQAFESFNKVFESQPELRDVARAEAMPASLRVKLSDPERFGAVKQEFNGRPGVDNVVNQADYLDQVFGMLNLIRNIAFFIALVQALAALLLISNTIQLSAFTRRTETGIMRLVGATRWYTQLPFLLEAVVSGLIGAILGILGLSGFKALFLDRVMASFGGIVPSVEWGDVAVISPILLLVAAVISAGTGYVTLRLYVRL
ncbi:cell division transport system permease protein [Saccharopolyspora antimicrobica]|uniref:Cell division protein FtsX n=2 Tax=Saccharopolyspora TaxID=1835 RepID=A0A1I5A8K5_9PSEU|nr:MULTISPECIES: permease-like cell division protein FtsX [Saccharopolyspora]RKT83231.1 cell division transport system permease protein [Saccharopolyspora antimicrobica]SEG77224.1 cell division protein FtsX [Saccharopolyspora kobensis]SFD01590.1 cell division transport system permease protein [Saccharopolyspora kobensis]SFN58795.1 cell division transport system permease protein [Saccharopolyspora antimicrobica]